MMYLSVVICRHYYVDMGGTWGRAGLHGRPPEGKFSGSTPVCRVKMPIQNVNDLQKHFMRGLLTGLVSLVMWL